MQCMQCMQCMTQELIDVISGHPLGQETEETFAFCMWKRSEHFRNRSRACLQRGKNPEVKSLAVAVTISCVLYCCLYLFEASCLSVLYLPSKRVPNKFLSPGYSVQVIQWQVTRWPPHCGLSQPASCRVPDRNRDYMGTTRDNMGTPKPWWDYP